MTEETPTGRGNTPLPDSWSLEEFVRAAGKEEINLRVEMLKRFHATTSPVFSQDIKPKIVVNPAVLG